MIYDSIAKTGEEIYSRGRLKERERREGGREASCSSRGDKEKGGTE